jgi:hypothetical protein
MYRLEESTTTVAGFEGSDEIVGFRTDRSGEVTHFFWRLLSRASYALCRLEQSDSGEIWQVEVEWRDCPQHACWMGGTGEIYWLDSWIEYPFLTLMRYVPRPRTSFSQDGDRESILGTDRITSYALAAAQAGAARTEEPILYNANWLAFYVLVRSRIFWRRLDLRKGCPFKQSHLVENAELVVDSNKTLTGFYMLENGTVIGTTKKGWAWIWHPMSLPRSGLVRSLVVTCG